MTDFTDLSERERYEVASARLRAALNDEQWALHQAVLFELDSVEGTQARENEESLINDIARHFPGMGPAVRAVGAHVAETYPAHRGSCCETIETALS
jgi:hypothetical protein